MKILISKMLVLCFVLGGCASLFNQPAPAGNYQESTTLLNTTPHDVLNDIAVRSTEQHKVTIASFTQNQLVFSENGGQHVGLVNSNNGEDFGSNLQMVHHIYTMTFIAIQDGKNVVLNVTAADNGVAAPMPSNFIDQINSGLKRDGFKVAPQG